MPSKGRGHIAQRVSDSLVGSLTAATRSSPLRYIRSTLLFADVAEYARLTQEDEFGTATRIRDLRQQHAEPLAKAHRGTIVEQRGDGLLLAFDSSIDAVDFAAAFHAAVAELNRCQPLHRRIVFRVGAHAADVLWDGHAYSGHGVNLAARLAAAAQPGETVVSESVKTAVSAHSIDLHPIGDLVLKHLQSTVPAYKLGGSDDFLSAVNQLQLAATAAVLPFSPATGESSTLIGELLSDALITCLSRIRHLRVISRLSSRNVKRGRLSALASFGVNYVVSGTYSITGSKITVFAELSDVHGGEVLWSTYQRGTVTDVIAMDDDLIAAIANQAGMAMLKSEARLIHSCRLPSLASYSLLLGAIGLMHRSDPGSFVLARRAFEHLTERHPRHAIAHAWLAQWHVFNVTQGWFDDLRHEVAQGLYHANRAIDADSSDSLVLTAHALVNTNLTKDFESAKRSYDIAIAQNPNEALAWLHRGVLHTFQGRGEMAVEDTEFGCSLSPLDPWKYYYDALRAGAALSARQFESAIRIAKGSLQANPLHVSTLRILAIASAELDRIDDASAYVKRVLELDPGLTVRSYRARSASTGFETGDIWARALARAGLPQ